MASTRSDTARLVTTTLTDDDMRTMVGQVDLEQRDLAEVVTEYLTNAGIL